MDPWGSENETKNERTVRTFDNNFCVEKRFSSINDDKSILDDNYSTKLGKISSPLYINLLNIYKSTIAPGTYSITKYL